jgi:O-antigen/teichoic acid export membrane protein
MTLPFVGGSVLLLIFAPFIVRLLYGPKFGESVVLLRIMSATPVLQAVGVALSTFYMLALGHEKEWAKVIRRMTILNFVLLFPLIYLLPPDRGVAVTQVLLDVFAVASYYWFYRRTVHKELARAATLSSTAVS